MPSSRLIDANFVDAFKKRIMGTAKLQIASAWMSDSGALRALIERGKERCKVQAIIGTYGEATNAPSLRSLADKFGVQESLRLAETAGLFHPKLLLFHRRNGIVAWIGSANFTHGGLEGNEELLLETNDPDTVEAMEKWFGSQWTALKGQDSEKALKEYETKWTEAQKKRKGVQRTLDELVQGGMSRFPLTIRMRPEPHKPNGRLRGVIEYGEDVKKPYDSAADGLRQLLVWLSQVRLSQGRDNRFLMECSRKDAFKKTHNPLIATARSEREARGKVYVRGNAIKPITVTSFLPREQSKWAWWISEDTSTEEKWKMVETAVEVANAEFGAGIELEDKGAPSWPGKVKK